MLLRPQTCCAWRQRTEVKQACFTLRASRALSCSCCLPTAFTSNATPRWYAIVNYDSALHKSHWLCVTFLSGAGPADSQVWTGMPVLGDRVSRARKAHSSAWQPTGYVHARPPCCHRRDGLERSVLSVLTRNKLVAR